MWVWDSAIDEAMRPERHVEQIFHTLQGREDLLTEVAKRGWVMNVGLSWFAENGQAGITLKPITLGKMAALNLNLNIDLIA